MQRRGIIFLLVGILIVVIFQPVHAANIHLRYFESADLLLTEERFQRYSFSALAGENVTIVVYGLDESVIPMLTLFDPAGSTLLDNPNEDGKHVVAAKFTPAENGIYTFLVTRQTEAGGLIRVMVFEGEPLTDDRSLLDEVDPLLPARAYLFAGDDIDPVEIEISVVEDDDPQTPAPDVYAARGTDVELPPLEERTQPVTRRSWRNDNSERVYTLNVRALPEPILHINGFFSRTKQDTPATKAILRVDVNEGGVPEFVARPTCGGFVLESVTSYGGPSTETYQEGTALNRGQSIEIVGENAEFYLIVDPNSETGGTWVAKDTVDVPVGLESEECERVEEVEEPPVEEEFEEGTDSEDSSQDDEDLDDEDLDDEDLDDDASDDSSDDSGGEAPTGDDSGSGGDDSGGGDSDG